MSPWFRTTALLLAALVALVALDVGVRVMAPTAGTDLPVVSAVSIGKVRRVRMVTGDKIVEVQRIGDGGTWELVAPVKGPADSAAARDLVQLLRRETPMQVKLGEGSLDEFGLQSGTATRLQIFQDETTEPVVDLYVGHDTVGGASFVRFPDDDSVYRAQIGGGHRIKREARDWKDRQIFTFEPESVTALAISLADGQNVRFAKTGERWSIPDLPEFPVDQETVSDVLKRLATKRAGQVLPGDFPLDGPPLMTMTVEGALAEPVVMSFFDADGVAYVTRTGRDEVFQVAQSWARQLALPRMAWLDRQLVDVDRAQILRMVLHDPNQGDLILEQDVAMGGWKMIQPPNVDVNLREANQAAIKLGGLRADGIANLSPSDAGFPSPVWIELQLINGDKRRIELGRTDRNADRPLLFVRTADQPARIGVITVGLFLEIRKAWGQ